MARCRHRAAACSRIAYMPQGLGKNLYPDLSVRENIEFFGRLFGQWRDERERRIDELLRALALRRSRIGRPGNSPAACGRSSGFAARSIHDPDLLILDEPTTGVDPLSRRQFWDLIERMRVRRPEHECDRCHRLYGGGRALRLAHRHGRRRMLATGSPAELKAQAKRDDHRGGLHRAASATNAGAGRRAFAVPPRRPDDHEAVITARDLTCRFGDFTAVDRVSFTIERGEIFGFLGLERLRQDDDDEDADRPVAGNAQGEALLFGQADRGGATSTRASASAICRNRFRSTRS